MGGKTNIGEESLEALGGLLPGNAAKSTFL
jgi:hypothetical protein